MRKLKLFSLLCLLLVGVGQVWADSPATFSTTSSVFSNSTKTIAPITVTFGSGVSWQNDHVRFYANNTLTISCSEGYNITSVTISAKSGYANSAINGFSANSNKTQFTWSGTSTSIATSNTGSAQARITQIEVAYESSGSTPQPTVFAVHPLRPFNSLIHNSKSP